MNSREKPDLCLVLGGDGSILYALRRYADTGVPVFGINFGTIGFLAAVEREQLEDGLRRAFSGEFEVVSMPGARDGRDGRPKSGRSPSTTSPSPASPTGGSPSSPTASAAGGRPRPLRRARRRHPGRLHRLQPRQRRADPRLGVEGYVVSFIAPHTLTARAPGGRAREHALGPERRRPRPGRDRDRRRAHGELAPGEEIEVRFRDGVGSLAQLGRKLLRACARSSGGSPSSAQAPPLDHLTRGVERKWWTLLATCVAMFMLLLDITIVNVALPEIQRDLDASFSDLQWVVDAYALTLAGLLLAAGSLGDRLGRRRVFASGFAIFTLASLLCGLADRPDLPQPRPRGPGRRRRGDVRDHARPDRPGVPRAESATAFGIWGATVGGAVAIGPLVGGALTDGFGWEWIFFVNVPIGIAAIVLTLSQVAESPDPDAEPVDWPGVVTFSASLFLLVFALVRGNAEGWSSFQITGR